MELSFVEDDGWVLFEGDGGEFGNVVDKYEVGVGVSEVVVSVVEKEIEGKVDGGGDEAKDGNIFKGVDLEFQVAEGGVEGAIEKGKGGLGGNNDEVEDDIFGAGGVLKDEEDDDHEGGLL